MKGCPVTIALLVGLLAAAPLAAQTPYAYDRIDETLTCRARFGLCGTIRQGGTLPIVLEFQNEGEARSIRVRTGGAMQVTGVFNLPAGRRVRRFLYVPVPADIRSSVRQLEFVDAENGSLLKKLSVSDLSRLSYTDLGSRSDLLGITVSKRSAMTVSQKPAPGYNLTTNAVSPEHVPPNWVGLAGLDVVVVHHSAWSDPEFPRRAVMDWMAMGGVCLLAEVPDGERAPVRRELAEKAAFFADVADGRQSFHVGMGGGAFVGRETLAGSQRGFFASLGHAPGSNRPSGDYQKVDEPQIGGVGELPFVPVLLALLVFSLLVGPVGWWYLVSRKRMGLLYYAAAPAASALAIALVVALDVSYEGFRPRVSCAAVRLLDQHTKRAIDLAQFGVYAPFAVGTELKGSAAELPHFFGAAPGHFGQMVPITLAPGAEGPVYRGVLPPREKVWFGRQEVQVERSRLVVRRQDGQIAVENHLEIRPKSPGIPC